MSDKVEKSARVCRDCPARLIPKRYGQILPEGVRAHASRGLCAPCYAARRRAGTLDEAQKIADDPSQYVPARERSGTFGKFQLHQSHLVTGTSSDG